MSPATVTLLTDYGSGGEHVGALHAVLATRCPGADRIDLAHDVPPGDVRWGAILLARLAPLAPAGAVHLAVVDPGVGGPRRAVAIALDDGGAAVGPDNGLLALLAAGRARGAVVLDSGLVADGPVAATFHGRDLFAPAAARLAAGAPLERLGAPTDPGTLVAPDLPGAAAGPGTLEATVAGVDSFGNVTLLARRGDLEAAGLTDGRPVRVVAPAAEERAIVGRRFADAPEGGLVCFVDSWGMVALAVNLGDAAERLGARPDDRLRLELG